MSGKRTLTPEDVARMVPGPGSMIWKKGNDPRVMAGAGYALLLQVAHPTVGAAVKQQSGYRTHPYARLFRSIDYLLIMSFGGPEAAWKTARSLREIHRDIRGVTPDGRRYNAFEPEAWAWVHTTLGEAAIAAIQSFASPMNATEIEQYYAEWRAMGAVLGVGRDEVGRSWTEHRAYLDAMIHDRLADNDTVQEVIEVMRSEVAPPFAMIPRGIWRRAWRPVGETYWLVTAGLMPSELRRKLGIRWSRAQERRYRLLARASRALGPAMPVVNAIYTPQRYLLPRARQVSEKYLQPDDRTVLRGLAPEAA